MRKITEDAVNAFMSGNKFSRSNTKVIHFTLYLHGNLIAKKDGVGLKITNAGWFTATTKERLNGLPNVNIVQRKGVWYLNGKEWDGSWIYV